MFTHCKQHEIRFGKNKNLNNFDPMLREQVKPWYQKYARAKETGLTPATSHPLLEHLYS